MPKLVIDIETIGEEFDGLDETTKSHLTSSIRYRKGSKEYKQALHEIENNLVFSPTTGEIIVIGLLDLERDKAVVYFQAPGEELKEFTEKNVTYKPMSEHQMVSSFWGGVVEYDEFITFNGRGFDIPYLIARAAVHKVKITKDLMSNRYVESQRYGAKHVDLQDQLGYYGAIWRPGGLHMWCRAFGIASPKEEGVDGGEVKRLFKAKRYIDIARYNARDLFASKNLYNHWREYMKVG